VGECDFDGEKEVIATEVKVKERGCCCGTTRHLLVSERIISFDRFGEFRVIIFSASENSTRITYILSGP
jgi:hypothetical protein